MENNVTHKYPLNPQENPKVFCGSAPRKKSHPIREDLYIRHDTGEEYWRMEYLFNGAWVIGWLPNLIGNCIQPLFYKPDPKVWRRAKVVYLQPE